MCCAIINVTTESAVFHNDGEVVGAVFSSRTRGPQGMSRESSANNFFKGHWKETWSVMAPPHNNQTQIINATNSRSNI
jgi:hypothetical protein